MTPAPSTPSLLVSHSLRIKGVAAPEAIGIATGLQVDQVVSELQVLLADGHAIERTGRVSGWSPTADGKAADAAGVAEELDVTGTRATVDAAYRDFLGINHGMLQLCSDWQLRGDALNDHSDAEYDARVVARLHAMDAALLPILAQLVAALGRFGPYPDRFRQALGRVDSGDHDWFAKPMIDSYHTVWFELHEDLLSTLGIERADEAAAQGSSA